MNRLLPVPLKYCGGVVLPVASAFVPSGAGGGGKGGRGGSQSVRTPYEEPNTLRSRQIARVLDLLCEGPIVGVRGLAGVFLDDTPVMNADGSINFPGIEIDWRLGYQVQNYMPGFAFVESEQPVSAQLKAGVPLTRTISLDTATRVRLTVSVPSLSTTDATTGDIHGTFVDLRIEQQSNGGGFWTFADKRIEGKTMSKYQASYEMPLSGSGPWDIRVTRLTPDSTSATLANDLFWESYTEVQDLRLTYPNSAAVGLRVDAAYFQSIPRRSYLADLMIIKVPSNYDPQLRTYSGAWDGSFKMAWTNNPAWVFYDMVTSNRYGLGDYIDAALVDKWTLYAIAQYCDGMVPDGRGGYEPRFTCNLILTEQAEALKVLQDLASVFRAMIFYTGSQILLSQDRPADVTFQFSNANVIDGHFTYEGSAGHVRHTVALVSWNNPAKRYALDVEYVEDPAGIRRYGYRETQAIAVGCTSRGQATRVGKWLLYTELHETETVSFSVGLDASFMFPGAIIQIADNDRAGENIGGRVLKFDATNPATSTVYLDRNVKLAAGESAEFSYVQADGILRVRNIGNSLTPVDSNTLQLDVSDLVPSQYPTPNAPWVLTRPVLKPTLWRVISSAEKDNISRDISALSYDPSKFNYVEYGWSLEDRPTSSVTTNVGPPVLTVTDNLYLGQDGTVHVRMSVSWERLDKALYYIAAFRPHNGNWVNLPQTQAVSIDIDDVATGVTYDVRVTPYNLFGQPGTYADATYTVVGLAAPPADVKGVKWAQQESNTVGMWQANKELDFDHYEIRTGGTSWDTATVVVPMIKATLVTLPPMVAGTYAMRVKAVDSSGNYSTGDALVNFEVKAPNPVRALTSIWSQGNVVLSWQPPSPELYQVEDYVVYWGNDAQHLTMLGPNKTLVYQYMANWQGDRRHWVAARDIVGNIGTPVAVDSNPAMPRMFAVGAEVIDNNVLLRWRSAEGSLPIRTYHVYSIGVADESSQSVALWAKPWLPVAKLAAVGHAAPFQSGKMQRAPQWGTLPVQSDFAPPPDSRYYGTNDTEFTTIFEQVGGHRRYFITAEDTAGNLSNSVSCDVILNPPPDFVLIDERDLSVADAALTNAALTRDAYGTYSAILAPPMPQQWQEHYQVNTWQSPQNQVDAGFPIYVQPTEATGLVEWVQDMGTVLPVANISVGANLSELANSANYQVNIAVRKLETDPWTEFPATSAVTATDFQYVRVQVEMSGGDGKGIVRVKDFTHMSMGLSTKTDDGTVQCVATDANGTWVQFNVDFSDVRNIQLTANGAGPDGRPLIPVLSFDDVPHPQGFSVYLFDSQGNRVDGPVFWAVKGV